MRGTCFNLLTAIIQLMKRLLYCKYYTPLVDDIFYRYANDKGEFKERVAKSIKECMQIIMETTDQGDPHDIK